MFVWKWLREKMRLRVGAHELINLGLDRIPYKKESGKSNKVHQQSNQTRRSLLNALADVRWEMVKGKDEAAGWRPRINQSRP